MKDPLEIEQIIEKTLRNLPDEKVPEMYKAKLKRMIRAREGKSWYYLVVNLLLLGSFWILTSEGSFLTHSFMSKNILLFTYIILGFLSIGVLVPIVQKILQEEVEFLQRSETYLDRLLSQKYQKNQ